MQLTICVEPCSKAVNITSGVTGSPTASNSREPNEGRSLLSFAVKEGCRGDIGPVIVTLEDTVSTSSSCVDGTLGHTLMIEMSDLLTQDEIFEKGRSSSASLQAILIVDWTANIRGQKSVVIGADSKLAQELFGSDRSSLIRDLTFLGLMSKGTFGSQSQASSSGEEE